MTQTIHKYKLAPDVGQTIMVPLGANVIHAGVDPAGDPCIWAEVDQNSKPVEERTFWMFGTGHAMPPHHRRLRHIGSFLHKEEFIWHVYEEQK